MQSTVAVTSRSAYGFLSAGASGTRCAHDCAAALPSWCMISSLVRSARQPDGLELIERAARVPQSATRQLRNADAVDGDERCEREGDLIADAAGGCLSAVGLPRDLKSIRSPELIIAWVHWAISSRSIPLRKIAIASAAICSSPTTPRV